MPRRKIDLSKKMTSQIVKLGSAKAKRISTPKQQEAARKNLEKAREAKFRYKDLRERGFDTRNVFEASRTIENYLEQSDAMRSDTNPAVARLYDEIVAFKTEDELASMSKGEFYKYTSSIREFLNNPISAEDAARYLQDSLRSGLIRAELVQQPGEDRESYLKRRQSYVKFRENDVSKKAFALYRRVMETNAGQIIKARMSPAAYGSDNLIADIFDFASMGIWDSTYDEKTGKWDKRMESASVYWQELIEEQYQANLEHLQYARSQEALEIPQFSWRGGESYGTFIRRHKL